MTSGDATLRKLGAAERAPGDKPLARPAGLKWAQPSATTLCDPGALWRPVRCWCGLPDAYLPAFLPVRWIQSEQTRLPSPRNTACPITSNTPPTTPHHQVRQGIEKVVAP
jgi:hypothetical protein